MKLSSKFLLYNLLSKGLILLLFLLLAPWALEYFSIKNTDRQLVESRDKVMEIIHDQGIGNFIQEENGFGSYNLLKEEYILLENYAGPVLPDTIFVEQRILEEETVTYRVLSHIFEVGQDKYLLEIGKSLNTIQQIASLLYKIILAAVVFFLLSTFFLDTAFTKRILGPFRAIVSKKLSQIKEPQQFPYQAIPTSTEEFRLLDESISDMMQRIQKAFNQERVFISHASHELKTPISILQTKLESLFGIENIPHEQLDKLLDMQETIQRMKKSVNALLLISKVNNAQFVKTEKIPVKETLEEILEEWSLVAEENGIKLRQHQLQPFVLEDSNLSLFRMMVTNALSNAIKYTKKNSSVEVLTDDDNGLHKIIIKDEGEGISADILHQVEQGTVFLKNVDKDSSGFGLQILRKTAAYLGIQVQFESTSMGTTVTFLLPKE